MNTMTEAIPNLDPARKRSGSSQGPSIKLEDILAPVDFSLASQHGVSLAGRLAERFGSRLHLVHVVEPPVLLEWGYAHVPIREAKLHRAADERLPQFPLQCDMDPKLVHSAQIRSGEAEDEICKVAAELHSDLIVLESHGLGGIQHAFLGSTAERVVRCAPCPVLTVRDRALQKRGLGQPSFDLKRILVTTDFSEESKKAFPYALALARTFEASLLLLYVVPEHLPAELGPIGIVLKESRLLEEARQRLPRFRQAELDPHIYVDTLALHGSPAHEICKAAEAQGSDLIVMATHGHTGLKRFLIGSVTENVVRHAPCSVLVVRERERDFVRG